MELLYWPDAQGVHEALPPLAYSPAAQARHDSCPSDDVYFPPGHAVQLDAPVTLLY